MIHFLLPLMRKASWGRIINIASASIFEGNVGQTHYVAAKADVTSSLAMEVGDYGLTAKAVAPGLTSTEPLQQSMPEELITAKREVRAFKRDEQPSDLAGPVFLLVSPDSNFVIGQLLVVDGGKIKH